MRLMRLCALGDDGVGKSSLFKFFSNNFSMDEPTPRSTCVPFFVHAKVHDQTFRIHYYEIHNINDSTSNHSPQLPPSNGNHVTNSSHNGIQDGSPSTNQVTIDNSREVILEEVLLQYRY